LGLEREKHAVCVCMFVYIYIYIYIYILLYIICPFIKARDCVPFASQEEELSNLLYPSIHSIPYCVPWPAFKV
jgi:hypothetical protein